jgi:hypothetical protein
LQYVKIIDMENNRIKERIKEQIYSKWKLENPKLILSILNSNIQSKYNSDILIDGFFKVAVVSGKYKITILL